MDEMRYELLTAQERMEDIEKRIKNYVGKNEEYVTQMMEIRARMEIKISKLVAAITMYSEAREIKG